MANPITGLTTVTTAMRVETGRKDVERSELSGNPQPVQRQNLPHGTNDTAVESPRDQTTPRSGELTEAVKQINGHVQNTQRDLLFSIDEGSGRTTITVLDSKTQEIIRQIPSEEVLAMVERLKDLSGGLLFSSDV